MTEKEVQRAIRSERWNQSKVLLFNVFLFRWESDVIEISDAGVVTELEIKLSKADFQADFKQKKDKHARLSGGGEQTSFIEGMVRQEGKRKSANIPGYFYYVVTGEIEAIIELPYYSGLYVARELPNGTVDIIRKKEAPRLSDYRLPEIQYHRQLTNLAYRYNELYFNIK